MIHKYGISREKGYQQTDRQTDKLTVPLFILIIYIRQLVTPIKDVTIKSHYPYLYISTIL